MVSGSSFLHRTILCLIFSEPSFLRSLIKESKFCFKLLLVRNGPYQYMLVGPSVSTLAHQANPSLFPNFLINFHGPFKTNNSCTILYNLGVKIQ